MNLLIVDDEPDVIDGILSGIDLKAIGFSGVFTARSGEEAVQILLNTPVNVLVTDIEMSDMNGLSLLEWVRQHKKDIVTIFCTAYSDFNYAKKALELQAFDYYLKPIRYQELSDKLSAAYSEVLRIQKQRQHSLYGDYWIGFQKENCRDYWRHVFHRVADDYRETSKHEEWTDKDKSCLCDWMVSFAASRKLPYSLNDSFTFVIFDLYKEDKLKDWNIELLDTAFENVINELFSLPNVSVEAIVAAVPGTYQLVLRQLDGIAVKHEQLIEVCQKFIDFCNLHMKISADCYYCIDLTLGKFPSLLGKACMIFRDDITGYNQIYDVFPYRKKNAEYANPMIYKEMERQMEQNEWEKLLDFLEKGLDYSIKRGTLTRSGLLSVQLDFMQMIHSFLASKGIPAHTIFFNDDYRRLYESAADTRDSMHRFFSYVVYQAMQAANSDSERTAETVSRSVTDTVLEYIEAHLSEELNRATLSKVVFMNPDYLAKLFKDKTGRSLAAYIKERRIEKAKTLLSETDLPVSSIAQSVGYDNLSYFSSVFHDKTGLQPVEYRRRTRKEQIS